MLNQFPELPVLLNIFKSLHIGVVEFQYKDLLDAVKEYTFEEGVISKGVHTGYVVNVYAFNVSAVGSGECKL